MDAILIGPPGSGKSAAGRLVAARRGIPFVDLDDAIEAAAGRPIPAIFESEGEAGFRSRERAAVAAIVRAGEREQMSAAGRRPTRFETGAGRDGDRDGGAINRIVAVGAGCIVDPGNRWRLFHAGRVLSLWAPPNVLLRRLRGAAARPLLTGRDPRLLLDGLLEQRARWYAAGEPVDASGRLISLAARIEERLSSTPPSGTSLLRAETPIGRVTIGDGDALPRLLEALAGLDARRIAVVSEPVAWRLHGERLASALSAAGLDVVTLLMPTGEAAKTVGAYARLVRSMAIARLERGDPIVAIGGGALGDVAGFAAATYLRGVPLIHVPTTLVAQIDSAIGGKTAIDIPEGKNLVGAFHQPRAVVADVATLATLPTRQRRAALGEAIKYAALGDEALFGLLEREAGSLARGRRAFGSGAMAELVERCAWAKVEIVAADQREQAGRLVLNLGHSIGHAVEAAAGYRRILHGEAVAHGLRGALAVGMACGVTPPERAERIEGLLAAAGLAQEPPGVTEDAVRKHLSRDKKHAGGRLRWVLPTGSGVVVRSDVPEDAVWAGIGAALADRRGSGGAASVDRAADAGGGPGCAAGRDSPRAATAPAGPIR